MSTKEPRRTLSGRWRKLVVIWRPLCTRESSFISTREGQERKVDGSDEETYFLSVDCFIWASNFRPASVVVCGVSTSAVESSWRDGCHCQRRWRPRLEKDQKQGMIRNHRGECPLKTARSAFHALPSGIAPPFWCRSSQEVPDGGTSWPILVPDRGKLASRNQRQPQHIIVGVIPSRSSQSPQLSKGVALGERGRTINVLTETFLRFCPWTDDSGEATGAARRLELMVLPASKRKIATRSRLTNLRDKVYSVLMKGRGDQ